MRDCRRKTGKIKLDVTADQVIECWTRPLVRHVREVFVEFQLEQLARKVPRCPDTGRGKRDLGFCLQRGQSPVPPAA